MLIDAIDLYFENIARNAEFNSAWKKMTSEEGTFEDCVRVYKFAGIGNFFGEKKFINKRQIWASYVESYLSEDEIRPFHLELFCKNLSQEKQASMLHELVSITSGTDQSWISTFHELALEFQAS